LVLLPTLYEWLEGRKDKRDADLEALPAGASEPSLDAAEPIH
jgi:hypothetical protein